VKLTIEVDCGGGAFMTIVDPSSFEDGGVEWRLRYGNPDQVRFIAARVVESYDYLLCDEITMGEATRRLRLLRAARRKALEAPS
jgi:hypothetical protein